jgi:alpha-galactosidase
MGLSYWVPLSATGVLGAARRAGDTYNFRSTLSAGIQFGIFPYESFPIQDDYPWDWHRRMLADFRRAQPFFYGDYYPLTPCTAEMGALVAYQMHRPDMGQGMLLAFRRAQSPFVTADFRIEGLEPEADYELQDADSGRLWRQSGRELQERGVRVTLETLPASCLVFYLKRPCP